MDCREFNNKISLYIDNQLDETERYDFEKHMNECEECKMYYDETVQILKFTSDVEDVELPDNYKATLRSKLELEVTEKKKRKVSWRQLTTIAASLLLVVVAYGFISNNINLLGVKDFATEDSAPGDMDNYGVDENYVGEPEVASDEPMPPMVTMQGADANSVKVQFSESDKIRAGDYLTTKSDDLLNDTMKEETTGVKIIKEAYITIELKEYDNALDTIVSFVKERNGYIEKSETWYDNRGYKYEETDEEEQLKRGNLRIRIPEDSYYEALNILKDQGRTSNEQKSETNISQNYYDTKNVIKNLEVQEERLREILKKAVNVDEILRVENELNRVRTEIDRHQGTINNWDSLVDYSAINVTLIEVEDRTETIQKVDKGLFTKGKEGFISTINSLIDMLERGFIMLMTILPIILIITAIAIIVIVIIKRILRKREQ